MNNRKLPALLLAFALAIATGSYGQINWKPYLASVSFKIKNAGFTVSGYFKGFKGQLFFDPGILASSYLNASVQAETINTGIDRRDEHLKAAEYFDVAKYRSIEIRSSNLTKTNNGFEGRFNVTIKDKTREVIIPFNYTTTGTEAVFEGSFSIDRRDFGVGGNSLIMGNNVTVSIIVNAKR